MTNAGLILTLLLFVPLSIVIGSSITYFIYNRDVELMIKRAFKRGMLEIYRENTQHE